jgi:adenylate cyclase
VLFTDLVGFTEYTDLVGDERALQVLDQQTKMARAAIEDRERARVVKELGDGLMLWFDGAADGLDTAVALLARIDCARRAGEFPLAVRMGLHYGAALARGNDIVGQTVNITARLSDIAGPGELVVSEEVVRAMDDLPEPELRPLGPVMIKGVQAPIWIYQITPRWPAAQKEVL